MNTQLTVKTVDVTAKECFDKINGNMYFSAQVTINYCLNDEQIIKLPFQYGYGEQYESEAFKELKERNIIKSDITNLSRYCRESGIILRSIKIKNCKKRDCKEFGA